MENGRGRLGENKMKKEPKNKKKIPKEELQDLFNNKHLLPKEISKIFNCSDVTVNSYLKNYNINFIPYTKKCVVCGNDFFINSTLFRSDYCSKKCNNKDYYLKVRREKELKDYSEKICEYCGKKFIPPLRHPNVKCCNPKCNKKYYREKNRNSFIKRGKENYLRNKDERKKASKEWRINNPIKYKNQMFEYYKQNRDKIKERASDWHLNWKIDENERRNGLNLPLIGQGFKKEMELLLYVHRIFQNYDILTHHRKILGDWGYQGLELDIYIPDLKLAFEYMGKQHYDKQTYDLLSKKNRTKEEFEYQLYKDRCKKKICKIKGITLVRIKYDEKLSENLVLSKLEGIKK